MGYKRFNFLFLRKRKPTTKVVGFLFFVASEVYFKEAKENKKTTSASLLWFPCLPGITFWDARSESFFRMETKKQQALACYGFHVCPGFPIGMHAVNPFLGWKLKNNKR
ncbi:hypothetical protein DHD05_18200 [Arenibacter sp. N53]|nr:hypothetical protein [Arenibacter sp. N53]